MALFKQISIIGVGLIGGSLAKSIKKNHISEKIVGFFRKRARLESAIKDRIVDQGYLDLKRSINASDLIILALPPYQIIKFLQEIKNIIKNNTLIIDVGSTKNKITATADKLKLNFVGTHPLAGSEKKGCAFSSDTLFSDSLVVITHSKKTHRQSINKIKKFWKILNAIIVVMTPKQHDKILSFTSHLPHVISFSLMNSIPDKFLEFGSSGLRDSTRIALSDARIWSQIFLSNRKELLLSIDSFQRQIKKIKNAIYENKEKQLFSILDTSKNKRAKIN